MVCFEADAAVANSSARLVVGDQLLEGTDVGPLIGVPLVGFSSLDEAVALADDSPFGLQQAVFTRDVTTAFEVAHRLEAGALRPKEETPEAAAFASNLGGFRCRGDWI